MKTFYRILSLCILLPFLFGSSCPTPPDPEPPKPKAPQFTEAKVVVKKLYGFFEELIYLEWAPADSDEAAINEYVILPSIPFDSAIDTLGIYPNNPQSLPATRTSAYTRTENIRRYASGEQMLLYYSIFAVDENGISGDTSVQCTVALLKTPNLGYPRDSLLENRFQWSSYGILDEYSTNLILWNETDTTPLFISDTSYEFGFLYDNTISKVVLPQTLYPLVSGNYTWAVRMQKIAWPEAISFKIGQFVAP